MGLTQTSIGTLQASTFASAETHMLFTQLCFPWLYTCTSLILKRCGRYGVQEEKKEGDWIATHRCASSVCTCEDLGNLYALSENVSTRDLEEEIPLTRHRSSPAPQTHGEFSKEGKTLADWCLAPLNKTVTLCAWHTSAFHMHVIQSCL